jgi:hypothetical protein
MTIRFIPFCQQDRKSSISIQATHHHSIFDPRHALCFGYGVTASTIESSDEPPSPVRNPSDEELITRITRLQETLAVCPSDISARSELATLLEQLDKPEEALLNWNATLAFNPNNLKVREGVARCLQLTGGHSSPTGERGSHMATICGSLDRIEEDLRGTRWVYVKTTLSGETVFRARARVGRKTVVLRGKQRIDFSDICTGEFAEVTYHHIHADIIEADTIYVRPERDPTAC